MSGINLVLLIFVGLLNNLGDGAFSTDEMATETFEATYFYFK